MHPLLRILPPRAAFSSYTPERLLVGHGAPVLSDAAAAVDDALQNARHDIPKLIVSLPTALRST